MPSPWTELRLRDAGLGMRAGLTFLLLTMLGGYIVASLAHLYEHYQNRDERPGLSVTDIESAYRTVTNEALLLVALNRDHPPELPEEEKQILRDWLSGEPHEIRANYANLDFAEDPVEDIFLEHCLDCHSGDAESGGGIPLEFQDQVFKVAFSNEIQPTDDKILLASTHAHAPTMAGISIIVALLAYLTRLWRWLVNLLVLIAGAALLADIASWWLVREFAFLVKVLIGAGAAHAGAMAVLMVLIIGDLWMPRIGPRKPGADKLAKAVVHEERRSHARGQ